MGSRSSAPLELEDAWLRTPSVLERIAEAAAEPMRTGLKRKPRRAK